MVLSGIDRTMTGTAGRADRYPSMTVSYDSVRPSFDFKLLTGGNRFSLAGSAGRLIFLCREAVRKVSAVSLATEFREIR